MNFKADEHIAALQISSTGIPFRKASDDAWPLSQLSPVKDTAHLPVHHIALFPEISS